MLKALELVGFKSFADRTRFDFPDGITVVVGPNGSGKSNVVDAVKWVLGAQSAKALRGADMADVIFKGSAEGGRKPANSAEVVLILDNRTRLFSHDADEVHVSRRVFRSGEGEYAINSQPCRLKDVKDLFRGTGVGVDAYSLIEQGKVDRLLQASAKDRRGIFEEAAGISRFKAKKVEAERRLQRVDQNMLRLHDIVDEVGKRLSTLKSQATKANRYREMTATLHIKRQQLGWIDRLALQTEKDRLVKELNDSITAKSELASKLSTLQTLTADEQSKWQSLQSLQDAIQSEYLEAQRDLIAAENGQSMSLERHGEFVAEQGLLEERIGMLQKRATLTSGEIEIKKAELDEIELERQSAIQLLEDSERSLAALQTQFASLRQQTDATQKEQSSVVERSSTYRSQLSAYRLHIDQLQQSIDQQSQTLSASFSELNQVRDELQSAIEARDKAVQIYEHATAAKANAEQQLQSSRNALVAAQDQLVAMQGKSHGVRERLLVLEQLEQQYTGAGRGGQQLLRLARANQNPDFDPVHPSGLIVANVWGTVLGLVADLLSTEMHLAPLIDVALGTHADAIVLSNGQIIDWINEGSFAIDGRVTLLRMDRLSSRRSGEKIQLDGLRGVLGRADRMTKFDDAYEPLIRFLLGTTWFVDTLTTALELSHFRGAGLRFVTAECQLVESDGSITLGSLQTGLGLVSRRSEMQSAREEIKHVEESVVGCAASVARAQMAVNECESRLRELDQASHAASREATTSELRVESIQLRQTKLTKTLETHRANLMQAEQRLAEIHGLIGQTEIELAGIAEQATEHEEKLKAVTAELAACESHVQSQNADVTERRIFLARIEQRSVGLRTTIEQMQQDSAERIRNVAQAQSALEAVASKISTTLAAAAEFKTRAEAAQTTIQTVETRRSEANAQAQQQNAALQNATRQLETARRNLEKGQDRIQAIEQQQQQLAGQWDALHELYLREYQIDLHEIAVEADTLLREQTTQRESKLHGTLTENDVDEITVASERSLTSTDAIESIDFDQSQSRRWLAEMVAESHGATLPKAFDRAAIESEIIHLRQEIAAAGSVNMEALTELDELQTRYDRLSNHHHDLTEAKSSLIKTMAKIDEDSQDLFLATLSTIRTNFQELYRRSFGGGFADIVLEDPKDPDSGIEIVATPPGKTTLSNSLLSGGEKALTAVALIMAFFQYRPSPFCILDEVDAPFDEANIGRFVTVLREFLDTTKFIVVTHSKKTMTAANMIYGITMQESGVSRQVSVRFEEVGDKGEILKSEKRAA